MQTDKVISSISGETVSQQWHAELDLFRYFAGTTLAYGIFEDRFGGLRRRFKVMIQGVISDDRLELTEDFTYDDGEQSQRIWYIQRRGANHYSGTAADVIGEASGWQQGCGFSWRYRMNLPVNGRNWQVSFDDRMYLLADNILANRATVSKWGLTLGTVSIFFHKQD